ncbi:MAG: hypothetical protein NZ772_13105, partial [Cyanobacteria bacterium]|nr:hypothetical protein [Cyanobacteriota bacterium]MDW8202324.1 hypothetical protein [Cyanobacteriota bacterium SKYGB_h_bin112]
MVSRAEGGSMVTNMVTKECVAIVRRLILHPIGACTGAAIVALTLAAAAGSYLLSPKSVVAVKPSPTVRVIIPTAVASSHRIPSAVDRVPQSPSVVVIPPAVTESSASEFSMSDLQPFTTTSPESKVPASTQQLKSSFSPTQDPVVWTCGAIVVGCAMGSLMISRQLTRANVAVARGRAARPVPSRRKVYVPLPAETLPAASTRPDSWLALGHAPTPAAALSPATSAPVHLLPTSS